MNRIILIDNNIIDLEMITHIQADLNENGKLISPWFTIYVAGEEKPIFISRSSTIFNATWKEDTAKRTIRVQEILDELLKRWSPTMTKFDNLTPDYGK